ncbi:MAG: aldehyde dehydrogenase family protein [Eggerthellaceae bacterium]|nr:aldehyde dehydrogenase family protein [Eggerthellaceae bacterium]
MDDSYDNYGVANSEADVQNIINEMEDYYKTGVTLPVPFRLRQLRRLEAYLRTHEEEALQALKDDLGKSYFEGYATELGLVHDEIRYYLKKLPSWAKPKRVKTPIGQFPAHTLVYPYPFGVTAILSPWNYPLQLSLIPMVDAIGAGNCIAMKPSKTSVHTSEFLRKMCRDLFDPCYVYCFKGSDEMNDYILQVEFDKIMFTGSPRVGKEIMTAAAKNLTSVTLELGGKSPTFVAPDANVELAAKRIAWGKCLNSGKTCVAPDYALIHESIVDQFVAYYDKALHEAYGESALNSPDYGHMISQHHYDRVCGLIDNRLPGSKIVIGGGRNPETLQIEPTVVTGVTLEDPLMSQEIFGPALPILTWREIDEALEIQRSIKHPLGCYIFSNDPHFQQYLLDVVPSGGAVVNDVVVQASSPYCGFGGLQNSGIGAYHGKVGFDAFTHYKSTMFRSNLIEFPVRYPPYNETKMKILKFMMPD